MFKHAFSSKFLLLLFYQLDSFFANKMHIVELLN